MKDKILKITTSILACLTIFTVGSYCFNGERTIENVKMEEINEEPIVFTEVSHYDTLYDFSDSKVLAEHSDLVVIGKITNLGNATNYNPKTNIYGKACTPGNLEVMQVIKSNTNESLQSVDFMDIGGLIRYSDYEKSLLPAQKAKRDYLMQQSGISKLSRSNVYVKQEVENQLELEEGKTYIMYLYYNEDYECYMVVSQPYGIKEYNEKNQEIINHVTNKIEKLSELM